MSNKQRPAAQSRSSRSSGTSSGRSSSSTRGSSTRGSGPSSAIAIINRAGGTIREADLADLRVDQLRAELRKRGVTGTSNLRKPDLVKSLAGAMRRGTPARAQQASRPKAGSPNSRTGTSPARKSAGSARKSASASARKSTGSARKSASASARKSTGSARKSASASARKSTGSARKSASASARKSTGSARRSSSGSSSRTSSGSSGGGGSRASGGGGGIRTGPSSSRSLKYAQRIEGPGQHAERAGRSLVTTDHQVIRQWAQARGGSPATAGAPRDGRPSVLRIDFPGYGGANLRRISWNEWFEVFDGRRLNFIYQEQRTDGTPSNFFRLESPNREDA
jgi:hypothetical protein